MKRLSRGIVFTKMGLIDVQSKNTVLPATAITIKEAYTYVHKYMHIYAVKIRVKFSKSR